MNNTTRVDLKLLENWFNGTSLENRKHISMTWIPLVIEELKESRADNSNLREKIANLEKALNQKEEDRQYHMNCINHLAKDNGILGLTSEKTIELVLSRIEDQGNTIKALRTKVNFLETRIEIMQNVRELLQNDKESLQQQNAALKSVIEKKDSALRRISDLSQTTNMSFEAYQFEAVDIAHAALRLPKPTEAKTAGEGDASALEVEIEKFLSEGRSMTPSEHALMAEYVKNYYYPPKPAGEDGSTPQSAVDQKTL